jgi:hypothetical protein
MHPALPLEMGVTAAQRRRRGGKGTVARGGRGRGVGQGRGAPHLNGEQQLQSMDEPSTRHGSSTTRRSSGRMGHVSGAACRGFERPRRAHTPGGHSTGGTEGGRTGWERGRGLTWNCHVQVRDLNLGRETRSYATVGWVYRREHGRWLPNSSSIVSRPSERGGCERDELRETV